MWESDASDAAGHVDQSQQRMRVHFLQTVLLMLRLVYLNLCVCVSVCLSMFVFFSVITWICVLHVLKDK